ncbi:MAG: CRISPR-associated helicase Cas3', partial [Nitrososphaerales archaeon]
GCDDALKFSALFAIAGHHLKLDDLELAPVDGSGSSELVLYTDHPDVRALVSRGRAEFGAPLADFPPSSMKLDLLDDPLRDVRGWIQHVALPWWSGSDGETRKFIALVKALVIAADLVASAEARDGDARAWTESALERGCSREELSHLVEEHLGQGKRPYPFQRRVAESTSRVTFVHAGCGTGKTVAAYLWARERVAGGRKVFFCYPTTGTATQGYKDYVWDDETQSRLIESRLIHSRAEVDIEFLEGEDPLETAARYQSFAAWDSPLVLATTDTVLGLMQNNRRGLFSFPPIANAAFVFDEIHAYDDRLFGSLLGFLDAFPGVPVLLMTASLQRERLRRIQGLLTGRGETLETVEGPEGFETIKRYAITPVESAPWEEVRAALHAGKKVLWVSNTVDRARAVASAAPPVPLVYHSRYRYIDRLDRHRDVVDAFGPENHRAALAVTTQTCEVSLDISADLLVTDVAPIPALIQRMGRVNRREASGPKQVYVIDVDRPNPYSAEEIEDAQAWLGEVEGPSLSQADLASAFERFERDGPGAARATPSAWMDGGPFSSPEPLREAGYDVSIVREEDMHLCRNQNERASARDVVKYSVPMPLGPVARDVAGWRRLNGAFVSPAGRMEYSPEIGGAWK